MDNGVTFASRLFPALLAGAVAAALPNALLSSALGDWPITDAFGWHLFGSVLAAFIIGLPLFSVFQRFAPVRAWGCALAGGLISSPLLIILLASGAASELSGRHFAQSACGAVGGLVFWLVLRLTAPRVRRPRVLGEV